MKKENWFRRLKPTTRFIIYTIAFYAVCGIPWYISIYNGHTLNSMGLIMKQSMGMFRVPAAIAEWLFHTIIDFIVLIHDYPVGVIVLGCVISAFCWIKTESKK